MNTPLYNSLINYSNNIKVRLHMPGHKSVGDEYEKIGFLRGILDIDLTEIEGVDSLFHPMGSLKEAQKNAADLYQTMESIFLVNGASVGIIASIMSIVGEGDEIIVPRNAHRSVYNALVLTGAKPVYFVPEIDIKTGISMGIGPADVEKLIISHPRAKAVLINHPNFYGLCSDLEKITKVVHKYNKILIVDEACGSHFKFHPQLPPSGIDTGADLIIHGTHKNLPAMTQSAVIHINSPRVDGTRLKECLMILQSSSPSYVLLSSLEIAMAIVKEKGDYLFNQLYENASWFMGELKNIKGINILNNNSIGRLSITQSDYSKVIINFNSLNITGYQVESILNDKYGIQGELSDPKNIILTFTFADSKQIFERVLTAIREILSGIEIVDNQNVLQEAPWHLPELVLTPKEVLNKKWEKIKIEDSLGRVSMENFSPFPPGVPILRAGERIDGTVLALLDLYKTPQAIKVLVE